MEVYVDVGKKVGHRVFHCCCVDCGKGVGVWVLWLSVRICASLSVVVVGLCCEGEVFCCLVEAGRLRPLRVLCGIEEYFEEV